MDMVNQKLPYNVTDVRKREKKSEVSAKRIPDEETDMETDVQSKCKCRADSDNHWKHKVRPSGDYYFEVKPNSEGSTAKGSNNDGVCCNTCYKPRGKEYDVPMRWMDIDGRSWMIGDAGRLSVRKHARRARGNAAHCAGR
ncbi:hypothetical protein F4604DRAFT_1690500 [Suillus subluteus]|nr:hypothetical protein F4604DRAFT_1690500 [Suillus subluteus]